jgi:MGT family glycosyltransferase
MSRIVFFSIPAHGHTNPTLEVVRELTDRGHQVWYFSFEEFRERIIAAGAIMIPCDKYLPVLTEKEQKHVNKIVGKDFAAMVEMMVDTLLTMEGDVLKQLEEIQPDCIVSDSICLWGKLFAKKLNIRLVCSTTTFAMNQHTAGLMKPKLGEMVRTILGMGRINKKIAQLNDHGYEVPDLQSLIGNDDRVETIVYTSRLFQPRSETCGSNYVFSGPSIRKSERNAVIKRKGRPLVYISLGTVLNKNSHFYKNCIKAFKGSDLDVIISAGENTDIESLGVIPENITIKHRVDQIAVLKSADVFLTHCGMNSVNESLYFAVPMVLFPQHSEEAMVANRVEEVGAGVKLKSVSSSNIKTAVLEVLGEQSYSKNAELVRDSFFKTGGPKAAAELILNIDPVRYA